MPHGCEGQQPMPCLHSIQNRADLASARGWLLRRGDTHAPVAVTAPNDGGLPDDLCLRRLLMERPSIVLLADTPAFVFPPCRALLAFLAALAASAAAAMSAASTFFRSIRLTSTAARRPLR
mmetsp:Transcript_11398/g.35198  ORF Transcript_11398/g.35198 Transcript_11398/m.35198 type:complete len:121 (+) Transcript_11398:570-932(+)